MKTRRRVTALPEGVEQDLVAVDGIPAPVGVDRAVDRLLAVVGDRRRRPVLVGASDTGKTALVHGLAARIAAGARPGGARAIWQVSLRTLDGWCTKEGSVGLWLTEILSLAATHPSHPVVYVRDLGWLRRVDAEHDLAAALASTTALFLGEAPPGFLTWTSENVELAAVTYAVRVEEPDRRRTAALLKHHAAALKQREGVLVEPAALTRVLHHAQQLLPGRRLPGKAFWVLAEAVHAATARSVTRVTPAAVTARVGDALRLPAFLVDPEVPMDVAALGARLRARVSGQDEAVDAVVRCLALHKASLGDTARPLGVLLLAGPPGVGKTWLARAVAEEVFGGTDRLVRLPMGEYAEDWKVDQAFGQRGAQTLEGRRGVIARRLAAGPYNVLLLDEIEKAHPLVYRHLLRPLDEGVYVNGNDEEVSLRNTLVILTTCAGDEVFREPAVGFAQDGGLAPPAASVRKRLFDTFPADLLDRVDCVAVCPPLRADDLRALCQREILALQQRDGMARQALDLQVDEAVVARVVADALASQGVRGLRRSLERHVLGPLAVHLLTARPTAGSRVRVGLREGAGPADGARPVGVHLRPEILVPRRGAHHADAVAMAMAWTESTGPTRGAPAPVPTDPDGRGG